MYRPKAGTTRPDDLKRGASFAGRPALSKALGGTPFRGISYNADGDYVVVVSSSSGLSDHNYKDRWLDKAEQRYFYFGEWHGCGDMDMRAGNLALRDRSPRLFLFLGDGDKYVYVGRFRYDNHEIIEVVRPKCGHRHRAIVFSLTRTS
jgi:hypothetical protein